MNPVTLFRSKIGNKRDPATNNQKTQIKTSNEKKKPYIAVKQRNSQEPLDIKTYSPELYSVKGFWLFDFYPDELVVEKKRIIVRRNYFPFGTTTFTVPINKIGLFEVTHSLVFSALHVRAEEAGSNIDTTVKWLWHKEAQHAKDIVDGLRLAEADSLEIEKGDASVIRRILEALGS